MVSCHHFFTSLSALVGMRVSAYQNPKNEELGLHMETNWREL